MIKMNVSRFGFAARALACDSWGGVVMCDIRWYVISTGISVTDLLIKAIVGEIMVNSTAEASGFFRTPVG